MSEVLCEVLEALLSHDIDTAYLGTFKDYTSGSVERL